MIATLHRCGGATAQAHKACDRSATQVVTLLTSTGDTLVPQVEVEVQMCSVHADRISIGARRGRARVTAKRSL